MCRPNSIVLKIITLKATRLNAIRFTLKVLVLKPLCLRLTELLALDITRDN